MNLSDDERAWCEWASKVLAREAKKLRKLSGPECEICGYEIEKKWEEPYRGRGRNMCVHKMCWDLVWAGRWEKKMNVRELIEREKVIEGKAG